MNNMDVLKNNLNIKEHFEDHIENHLNTLGEFLRYHREQKLISLEELSMKTKIRIQQLTKLEENNFMDLPNPVYLKGFIKSICNELDVNVETALNYLNDNKIAETAIEDALEFLTPGKEIKKLPFDFKFFNRSKIMVNKKLLIGSVIAIFIGGSFVGNFRVKLKTKTESPSAVVTKMSFLEAKKLVQTDAVTDLAPPDGLGYTVDVAAPGEAVPANKVLMNNDLIEGKKVIVNQTVVETAPAAVEVPVTAPAPVVAPAPVAVPVAAPAQTTTPAAATETVAGEAKKLTVTAKNGTAFLVYRVNGEKKNKIYLRRGRTLELEGSEIRMDVGNPGAVEFTKNGEPFDVKPDPGSATLRIVL